MSKVYIGPYSYEEEESWSLQLKCRVGLQTGWIEGGTMVDTNSALSLYNPIQNPNVMGKLNPLIYLNLTSS